MKKLEYKKEGRFLKPTLQMEEAKHFGKFGHLRMRYIQEHREDVHMMLLMNGKLNQHLEEIDQKATQMVFDLVNQLKETTTLPDEDDTLDYLGTMNSLRKQAEEIVLNELIFV